MGKRTVGQIKDGLLGLSERASKVGGIGKLNAREQANYSRWSQHESVQGLSSSLERGLGTSSAQASTFHAPAVIGGAKGSAASAASRKSSKPKSNQPIDKGPRAVETKNGWSQDGASAKAGALGSWGASNIRGTLGPDQSMLGVAAGHAMRGAVGGGAVGGVTEAAQGGDFWAGAKAGAFNGAVGWGGYRMGMRATGATSYNPLAGLNNKNSKKQGVLSSAGRMINTTSTKANVSKQASTLLNHQQRLGLQDAIYGAGKKV